MTLRRRRRARSLALAAVLLTALVWALSIFFVWSWNSAPRTLPDIDPFTGAPMQVSSIIDVRNGEFMASNMVRGSVFPTPGVHPQRWSQLGVKLWPMRSMFVHVGRLRPGPRSPPSTTTTFVHIRIPVWIPLVLTLPPLLITHARVHRPLSRHRRGLCHRCAYNLASTPPDHACPECGTPRLSLPPRPGCPARIPT
jgi:hypothetical protein